MHRPEFRLGCSSGRRSGFPGRTCRGELATGAGLAGPYQEDCSHKVLSQTALSPYVDVTCQMTAKVKLRQQGPFVHVLSFSERKPCDF